MFLHTYLFPSHKPLNLNQLNKKDSLRRIRVFIGSSGEAIKKNCVYPFAKELRQFGVTPVVWNQAKEFTTGSPTIFGALIEAARSYDFALFIFTPDDEVKMRNIIENSVRDNVLFEFGLFTGAITSERVFAAIETSKMSHIASDLQGVNISRFKISKMTQERRQKPTGAELQRVKSALKRLKENIKQYNRTSRIVCDNVNKVSRKLISSPTMLEMGVRTLLHDIRKRHDFLVEKEISTGHPPFVSYGAQLMIYECFEKLSEMPSKIVIGETSVTDWMEWAEIRFTELDSSFCAVSFIEDARLWDTQKGRNYLNINAGAMKKGHLVERIFIYKDQQQLSDNCAELKIALAEHIKRKIPTYLVHEPTDVDDFSLFDDEYVQVWKISNPRYNRTIRVQTAEWEKGTKFVRETKQKWNDLLVKAGRPITTLKQMDAEIARRV